jgi:uncharacterized protein YggU (UPF0235/DUF167 family)
MYIKINALTAQKQEFLKETGPNRFLLSVREKAEQNMANRKIIELIAGHFSIPVSQVKIVSGHHKPSKMFDINLG